MGKVIEIGLTAVASQASADQSSDAEGKAVSTGLDFVEYPGNGNKCGCDCGCNGKPVIYRSLWDRLCQQMFGPFPPAVDTDNVLPDVTIWEDGVELVSKADGSYSFNVTTTGGTSPKPFDAILYEGEFYIIGEVD